MHRINAEDILNTNIAEAVCNLEALSVHAPALQRAAELIAEALAGGHKLLTCGNGGSAADAGHLAAEFVGRFVQDRRAYPAIALSDSASSVTALGNDYGYENVFARQVEAYGQPGDVLLALSTSGNSPNVLRALEVSNGRGLATIAFLGRGGGKMRSVAKIEFIINNNASARIQEAHQVLYHSLCQAVDTVLCRE